jgi:hypothetical protein
VTEAGRADPEGSRLTVSRSPPRGAGSPCPASRLASTETEDESSVVAGRELVIDGGWTPQEG